MMTNDELKKKIVDILVNCKSDECAIEYCSECDGNPCIENCREKQQADALIAAGIGDVKEAERRAEVAERALFLSAKEIEYLNGNFDSSAEFFATEKVIPYFMKRAEKELAEERKDD